MSSLILELVKKMSFEDLRALMQSKCITMSWDEDGLYMFNYGAAPDFFDPIVCEARGIIIDSVNKEVVCRGYDKFFNFSEPYAADIDWKSAKVQEKVDGSIIKCYYYNNEWRFATNAVINAKNSSVAEIGLNIEGKKYKTFDALIRDAENFKDIPFDKMDKGSTYIFELVSPYNHVIVNYDKILLYHTGTRDNKTGMERVEDIGIIKPKEYPLHSMDECITAVKKLNAGHDKVTQEGFVVVDKNYHRIKVKSPEYVLFHGKVNNHVLTKKRVIDMIESDDFDHKLFLEQFPELTEIFNWYEEQMEYFNRECWSHIHIARELVRLHGYGSREIHEIYKDDPYCFVVMSAVNRPNMSDKDIIRNISKAKKLALMAEYEKTQKENVENKKEDVRQSRDDDMCI